MSKKALRARLAAKQEEIARLKQSLTQASKNAAKAKQKAHSAVRRDSLAASPGSQQRKAYSLAESSVAALMELLDKAEGEAREIRSQLDAFS